MTYTGKAGRDTRPVVIHTAPDEGETDPLPAATAWRWFGIAAAVITVGMVVLMLERSL